MHLPASLASPSGLRSLVRPTTLLDVPELSRRVGVELVIASESFQRTGSFKFRAAAHLAAALDQQTIVTASSGNFGQALAHACTLVGKTAIVVMPVTSASVKIEGVRRYGGVIDLVDTSKVSRAERVGQVAAAHPDGYIASAYDDAFVIAGNASLGYELGTRLPEHIDVIVVPIGGGGLASGVIEGLRSAKRSTTVVGAEPLLGNDAARSLKAGQLVANAAEPCTIADGARTLSLGVLTWPILREGLESIVEVPESRLAEAIRLLFHLANLKAEPTGALSLGAVLSAPELFRRRAVCCVVSGGNVDPSVYASIIDGE